MKNLISAVFSATLVFYLRAAIPAAYHLKKSEGCHKTGKASENSETICYTHKENSDCFPEEIFSVPGEVSSMGAINEKSLLHEYRTFLFGKNRTFPP